MAGFNPILAGWIYPIRDNKGNNATGAQNAAQTLAARASAIRGRISGDRVAVAVVREKSAKSGDQLMLVARSGKDKIPALTQSTRKLVEGFGPSKADGE
jgi:hypothetical protein